MFDEKTKTEHRNPKHIYICVIDLSL